MRRQGLSDVKVPKGAENHAFSINTWLIYDGFRHLLLFATAMYLWPVHSSTFVFLHNFTRAFHQLWSDSVLENGLWPEEVSALFADGV